MIFSSVGKFSLRKEAELLVVPFWKRAKGVKAATALGALSAQVQGPINAKDFAAEEGETSLLYLSKGKERRCLLLGLGEEENLTIDALRRVYSEVAKFCQSKSLSHINVVLPKITELRNLSLDECLQGISEGILLTNYQWEELFTSSEKSVFLKSVVLVGVLPKLIGICHQSEEIAEGVFFARDLINGNADQVTPNYLAKAATKIAAELPSVTATILRKKQIEKEKLDLLLAVSRGSTEDPAFITLSYKGHPRSKDHTVVIGKGVTYDTGGLNLKPTGFMETMREDMSGSAVALATLVVAARLKLKVNVTAVVAATENGIDGNSYKPGDVYSSHAGTSVEIVNTDAEGRLTLADAISYSVKKLKPTRMIDFATLTGAMVVALGEQMSGFFSNNDALADALLASSEKTSEHLWRLPLFKPYRDLLKSDVADIKNCGTRAAGAVTAALFLEEFVEDVPWAHVDIAGTAFAKQEHHYQPKLGVGFGVRLMISFLQAL